MTSQRALVVQMCFCVCVFLGLLVGGAQCLQCPPGCECFVASLSVKCVSAGLPSLPGTFPGYVRTLIITGNHLSRVESDSFTELNITNLILSNNGISELASHSVSALLHLRFLDLSGNRLSVLHPEALRILDSPLQELNLSHALFDPRALPDLTTALRWGDLRGLLKLDLSGNSLSLLSPGMFAHLPSLQQLFLQTNALALVYSGTFSGLIQLKLLDLRENHFKTFQENALTELRSLGDIRILLGENPISCSCDIRAFVSWLNSSKADVDVESIRCSSPKRLAEFGLRGLDLEAIGCVAPSPDITDLTLQTSYVFLGLVLGFVGMVFLFVLYLNRKGMKKWIIETRDACRDVLEGYHYRYEIDTDPRRASGSVSVESGSMRGHPGLSHQLPTDTCMNRASTSPPADVYKPNMIC